MSDSDKDNPPASDRSIGRQSDSGDFVILGQVLCYPKTWKGVVGMLVIGVTVVAITYNLFVIGNSGTVGQVASMFGTGTQRFSVAADGKRTPYHTYQIGFWTPSPETDSSYRAPGSGAPLSAWQKGVSLEKVDQFGVAIRAINGVNGYRRWLVTGHGQSGYKIGYWWIVALDENIEVDKVINVYRDFWKTSESIYMEVVPPGDFGYKR